MWYPTRILVPTFLALAAVGLFAFGCDGTDPTTPAADDLGITLQADMGGVVHHASLGSPDVCNAIGFPTGCDANLSLVANEYADGSVKGQWHDKYILFVEHGDFLHVSVNCLNVVGNGAVVGGVISNGQINGNDISGLFALTAVVDNGASKNDTPDQYSFSIAPLFSEIDCRTLTPGNFPLFNVTNGQVTVY